ncbi:MAG: hypothetical protein E7107_04420 [Prevotella sp.]|jgi:hypothetical protein|nr:hypothetical protein [Prevotella sp.]
MELNGFYNEEELAELLDRNEITRKDFITHHSPELLKQYEDFCSDFGLEQDEDSAEQFMEEMQLKFDYAFHDNDITLTM